MNNNQWEFFVYMSLRTIECYILVKAGKDNKTLKLPWITELS
jgi:hypothetical protein